MLLKNLNWGPEDVGAGSGRAAWANLINLFFRPKYFSIFYKVEILISILIQTDGRMNQNGPQLLALCSTSFGLKGGQTKKTFSVGRISKMANNIEQSSGARCKSSQGNRRRTTTAQAL